jgi:hypothetical protein
MLKFKWTLNLKFHGNNETVGKQVEINGAKIYYEDMKENRCYWFNGGSIESMGNQIDY